jgi:hypothetical protein
MAGASTVADSSISFLTSVCISGTKHPLEIIRVLIFSQNKNMLETTEFVRNAMLTDLSGGTTVGTCALPFANRA